MSKTSNIEMVAADSSSVARAGYCHASEVLRIEFHKGKTYDYQGVTLGVYDGLMKAHSKGTFFHEHIKNKFNYRKVN